MHLGARGTPPATCTQVHGSNTPHAHDGTHLKSCAQQATRRQMAWREALGPQRGLGPAEAAKEQLRKGRIRPTVDNSAAIDAGEAHRIRALRVRSAVNDHRSAVITTATITVGWRRTVSRKTAALLSQPGGRMLERCCWLRRSTESHCFCCKSTTLLCHPSDR